MKKFVLIVEYGTGRAAMLVDTPDINVALKRFADERMKGMPQTKDFGLPLIKSAEILPVLYDSVYKDKEN